MRKTIFIIIFILIASFFPNISKAATAYDANGQGDGSGTSITWSHTCTGSDRALFVTVLGDDNDPADEVSGITYNSVSMTRVGTTKTGNLRKIYLYALANPSSGANNVVVSFSASQGYAFGASVSYTGVNQTTPYDDEGTYASGSEVSSPYNQTITTTVDNSWVMMTLTGAGAGAAGTDTTERYDNTAILIYDSNAVVSPAGDRVLQMTYSASHYIESVYCAILPPAAAVASSPSQESDLIIFE